MRIQKTQEGTVLRTGWTTPARRCPVHDLELELTFDETDRAGWLPEVQAAFNHDDNCIRWRCDVCVGSWTENYFLVPCGPDVDAARTRLRLTCPACGSRCVGHACVPACCPSHTCYECGAELAAEVELTAKTTPVRARAPLAPPPAPMMSAGTTPEIRSGSTRDFRRCPTHDEPMELVFVRFAEGDRRSPLLLAWWCDACARWWTEQHFRHLRRDFIPDAQPGAQCPSCFGEELVATDCDGIALCNDCDTCIHVRLAMTPAKEP